MALRLFNTLTRSLEEFVPLDPARKRVGMYVCGPTVYDYGHIGNFRTFVFADLVRRYLQFRGYAVTHVMNITDVEDKIIKRVRELNEVLPPTEPLLSQKLDPWGQPREEVHVNVAIADQIVTVPVAKHWTLKDFTSPHEKAFFDDLTALACLRPHQTPRATEHIADILALIGRLIERGFAYQSSDGSVYFSIEKYRAAGHQYGQLLNLNFDELRVGERVKADEYAKESLADFALWKARAPEDGDVFWPSPWGEGRPGWHIECSAMSMKCLGPSFDLHLGGEDLIFPHHEDEIAQSEGAGVQEAGCRFVKHWLHGAHLMIEGKKMSKSLGNFYTLRDLLAKGFTGREIRYLLLSAHYRDPLNFTTDGLDSARASLARLDECLHKLRELAGDLPAKPNEEVLQQFTEALDNDLNVSGAWGVVFEWVRELNRELAEQTLTRDRAASALAAWQRMDGVLGVGGGAEVEAPPEIVALAEERLAARQAKDFKRADALREQIKARGWVIEDTPKGPRLKPL